MSDREPIIDADKVSFPANSHKSKMVKSQDRKIEKIVSGKVIQKKKGLSKRFAEMFLGDDTKSVGQYLIHDVLIPAAKSTISDMVGGGIEMLLFGERRGHNTKRDGGRSYTSYGSYYKTNDRDRDRDKRDDRRDMSQTGRARHDFDEILLETRGEAEEVLSNLVDLTIDYNMASVADLYDLVGITSAHTDNKYGWTDLRTASVSRTRGGYLINLPRPMALD